MQGALNALRPASEHSALLLRKVEAGDLGRKTRRGFFTYN